MDSELDKKLEAIINHIIVESDKGTAPLEVDSDGVKRIKAAFSEAGYIDTGISKQVLEQTNLMTGQEWYNRMQSEITIINDTLVMQEELKQLAEQYPDDPVYKLGVRFSVRNMDLAARRAAGLTEADNE